MNGILSCAIEGGFRVTNEDRVKSSVSSKGNQIKWRRSDGIWAKADDMGYEGLSEQAASLMLAHSNFDEYAEYVSCRILEDTICTGCVSNDFLKADESLITLARLFQADLLNYDKDMKRMSASERLRYLIENTERITGMTGFGKWLGMLLEFDAMILNEDRHLNNIAVVKKPDGTYRPMPVFDCGAGFLSDTSRDYPLDSHVGVVRLISRVKSKPISTDFDKQISAVDDVVGLSLKFSCAPDTIKIQAQEYPTQIVSRVHAILYYQTRRYPHLFPKIAAKK